MYYTEERERERERGLYRSQNRSRVNKLKARRQNEVTNLSILQMPASDKFTF